MTGQPIARLLRPRSVAIVGASATPGALGAAVLANLERLQYGGEIHLINPNRDRIGDRPCLKSVDDLPAGVDVAVLAIPRAAVLDTVRALAARQVGAAIIFSAGFAEGGESGLADQRELQRIAAAAGMVIEGPNCLGFVNYVDAVALTFVETPAIALGKRPGIGIVSQSGAMAAVVAVTLTSKQLGLSYSISTGNEAASGVEDYVEFLLDDPHSQVIALVVEQFRQPRRFLELAQIARARGKSLVLLHPGRSSAARESAATHTGAMAGDYGVMRTQVARRGVLVAESLEEFGDMIDVVLRCKTRPSGGSVVLTESGAFKALTLDLCEEIGLPLPALTDDTAPLLRAALPHFVPVSNPVDLTAQGLVDPDLYRRAIASLTGDPRFGCIVLGIIQTDANTCAIKFPPIIEAIRNLAPEKPVIFAGLDDGAQVPAQFLAQLRDLGVPYFPSPGRAFRAIARICAAPASSLDAGLTATPVLSLPLNPGVIAEYRSKEILKPLGIPFPAGHLVKTLQAAVQAASDLGFPVVLKAQSADLPHKSDAGGVLLNIKDDVALAAAWTRLHANLEKSQPGLVLEGVLIEAMSKTGVELIIGGRNDAEWGPIVLVGFGGVQAEILKDVRLLAADLTRAEIVQELYRLKSGELLQGFRGMPPLDVEAAAHIVAQIGALLRAEPRIQEIDLNPVILYPQGAGAIALDALIIAD
jgi:acyl-CoA synthetase (NDP forming)